MLAEHVIIFTNGPTGPREKLYCWAVFPWQSQLSHTFTHRSTWQETHLHTFLHTYTYKLHTHIMHTYINTLPTCSHSFSPIQSCANLCKNESTPLDSLCDVCTFCTRACGVEWNNSSYCECVLLSSRGRGLTKSTFSSSEGCKCAENAGNASADSTRVQYRHSQRHLYYSQTGGPYNTTHTDMHCNHLEIYSTNQATQEIERKHTNTLWKDSFRGDLTWYSGSNAFEHNFIKQFRLYLIGRATFKACVKGKVHPKI